MASRLRLAADVISSSLHQIIYYNTTAIVLVSISMIINIIIIVIIFIS